MDEDTINVGKDRSTVPVKSVHMSKDQIFEGLDQSQHEVQESSIEMSKVHNEVLDIGLYGANIQTLVLKSSFNKDNFKGKAIGDFVAVDKIKDKVLDGGMEANKFKGKVPKSCVEVDKCLEAGVDMDKVQCKVLKGRMGEDVEKFQDKVLKYVVELNTTRNKFSKGNVDRNEIHDILLKENICLAKIIDVPTEAVDMNKIQNTLEDCQNEDTTPDEVLNACMDVNRNGLKFQKSQDTVFLDLNVADALNAQKMMHCQVRITTQYSLKLRMANHTAQDVYVRLLSHGERITGSGILALRNSVHLSPIKHSIMETPELEVMKSKVQEELSISGTGQDVESNIEEIEEDDEDRCHAISDTAYSPCSSIMPTPVEETQGSMDFLFQSPGRLLRELHANPEIQAEIWAEQQRELIQDGACQSLCSRSKGIPKIQAFFHSAARLIAVASILLLFLLVLLLVLLETDLDVSFLQDIRETPEFEQFHYEYYCPLRRWLCYKLEHLKEHLWGD